MIEAEFLLSVLGLFPERIGRDDRRAAKVAPGKWEDRLTTWVKEGKPRSWKFTAVPNLDKALDKLSRDPSRTEVETWEKDLGRDLALGGLFVEALKAARNYLVRVWPRVLVDEGTGPKMLPLSEDDALQIWSVYQVVNDPTRVLDEIEMGTLTPDQALAFRECYPEIYALAADALKGAISSMRARDDEFSLGWERESVYRTLLGMPPETVVPAPPPPPPEQATNKIKLKTEETLTQGESSAKTV